MVTSHLRSRLTRNGRDTRTYLVKERDSKSISCLSFLDLYDQKDDLHYEVVYPLETELRTEVLNQLDWDQLDSNNKT